MEIHRESQGQLVVTDETTGRSYILPQGGSDDGGVSVGSDTGTASEGTQEVQPETPPTQEQAPSTQEGSGQGFLEPYLKNLPEDQRPIVEPVLEQYRKEQDAEVTRRFEQLKQETELPTMIYEALLDNPSETLNWIADRIHEEQGVDVRSQLRDRWYETVGEENNQQGQGANQPSQDNEPLTQERLNQILEEREQTRLDAQKQEEFQTKQQTQQKQTLDGWIDSAAKGVNLSLDDSNGEDPLKAVIIMQANQLHESGVAKGQAAVEMATEAVAKRLGLVKSNGGNKSNQPNVASGGTPPPAPDFNVMDPKQRKARMLELMTSPGES